MTENFVYLSDKILKNLNISASAVADAIENALVAKAQGRLHTPPKTELMPGGGRHMKSMLAVGDDGFIVVKQINNCPANSERNLSTVNGAIMVLDAESGLLRAIIGANWITAVRTAALSVVAARRLANPVSETVAFIGTGVQAHSHLVAFKELFPLKRVLVLGRGQANINKLCQKAEENGLEAEACCNVEEALRNADLVVTSVTLDHSIKPFLDPHSLKSNAFAAIADACIPWLPASMNAFRTVIVDDLLQEAESKIPMLPFDQITGDLTALVSGAIAEPIDGSPAAFAFRGIALGDYAAAVLAVQHAEAAGVGMRIEV